MLNSAGVPLSPGDALRRVFEALAGGILLPDSPGFLDPCEKEPMDAAQGLTNQERDDVTSSSQQALRLIAFRQVHKVRTQQKQNYKEKVQIAKESFQVCCTLLHFWGK